MHIRNIRQYGKGGWFFLLYHDVGEISDLSQSEALNLVM